jgi:hypothetical protein
LRRRHRSHPGQIEQRLYRARRRSWQHRQQRLGPRDAAFAQRLRHLQEHDGHNRQADQFRHARHRLVQDVASCHIGPDQQHQAKDQQRPRHIEGLRDRIQNPQRQGAPLRLGLAPQLRSQSRSGVAPAARIASI